MKLPATLALAVCLSTPLLHADSPAAPDGATIEGSTGGHFVSPVTCQQLIAAQDLRGLNAGDVITGISLRLDSTAGAFPTTTFTRFDIRMGAGKAALTTTFANNFAGTSTLARSGALALAAGSMPGFGMPNSFGEVIRFTTPHTYAGGNLLVEIRSSAASPNFIIDAYDDTDGSAGTSAYGTGDTAATANLGINNTNRVMAFEVTRAGAAGTVRIAIPDGAATEGNAAQSFDHAGGLSGQMRYLPAQLGSLKPGDEIAGIAFRLDNAVTDFRSTTFSRFDIQLGKGSAGFSIANGTVYANNFAWEIKSINPNARNRFASGPEGMRSGPLTLFLAGISGNPNPFATRPIHFARPYTYTGGPLVFETRSSPQTTPLLIDSSTVSGYGGGLFNVGDPNAVDGDVTGPNANWAMELIVRRDKTAPAITFKGTPKLKKGLNTVSGSVGEAGMAATIRISAVGAKTKIRVEQSTSALHRFSYKFRSADGTKPVDVKVIATDASGNRTTTIREYRP